MKQFLTFLVLFCATTFALAQGGAPKKFNYQAVPRKADGTLLAAGSVVKVQFTLTEDGPVNIKYGEEHVTTVSQHGVVNAIVGGGAASGILPFNFDAIDWKNHSYFLAVAVDLNGNNLFDSNEKFASSQLLSVPYALYAEKSGSGGTGGPTYQAGAGIQIDAATNTISNTGDPNAADDLTNSSAAGGDLTGNFGNLNLKTDVVGGAEIQNGSVGAADLGQMGATNGQILKWNGSNWVASNDETGAPNTGLTQVAVGTPLTGNGTSGNPIVINSNGIGANLIQDGGVGSAELNQMGATNGQILKWNGSAWVASNDETGAPNTGLTQVAVTTPLAGNGTAGNPIALNQNGIGGNLIQNGGIEAVDLGQMGATTGQILKWNGSNWVASNDETGAPNTGLTQVAVAAPLTGNGTAGSPISIPTNSIGTNLIENGSLTNADFAPGTVPVANGSAGISVTYTSAGTFNILNTSPDLPVVLNGTGGTTVTGNYPNFTINSPAGGGGGGSVNGTTNYLAKFTNATTVGNSALYETAGKIGINTTSPEGNLDINGGELVLHNAGQAFNMTLRPDGMMAFEANGTTGDNSLVIDDGGDMSVNIGSATPVPGFKLHVVGKAKFDTGVFFGTNEGFTDGGSNEIATNADLRPTVASNATTGFDLGTPSFRWRNTYGQNGYFNTEVGIGTTNVASGFKLHVAGKAKFDDGVYLGSVENFFDGGSSQIGTNSTLRPHINATTTTGNDLGTTNFRWQHIYGLYNILGEGLKVGSGVTNFNATAVHFIGNDNDGVSNATLKIESGTSNMLFDGNEIDCATGILHLQNNSSSNLHLVNGGGDVGIGTTAPTAKLSVNGTANKPGGGSWATFSDRRLKQNIAKFSMGIEVLNQIKPVTFHYNGQLDMSPDPEYVGIIAQDLQEIAPFMVSKTEIKEGAEAGQTFLNVDPSAFTYILINSVQSQQAEIKDLRAKLAAQQAQIDAILLNLKSAQSANLDKE
jgi:hypothetical protein